MKQIVIVSVLSGLAFFEAAHGQVHKCSVGGQLVYQQEPCEGGRQILMPGTGRAAQDRQLLRFVEVKNASTCASEASLVFQFNLKTEGYYVLHLVFPNLDMNTNYAGSFPAGVSEHQIAIPNMRRAELTAPISSVKEVRLSQSAHSADAALAEMRNLKLPTAIQPCPHRN